MAVISIILAIISLIFCFFPIYGLLAGIFSVVAIAILKKRKEYGINKQKIKGICLIVAIASLTISIFVTGVSVTKGAIKSQTEKALLNDVSNSFNATNLFQAQQHAETAWNEARFRGIRSENMEQYIRTYLENVGINTVNFKFEITKTGVVVKMK